MGMLAQAASLRGLCQLMPMMLTCCSSCATSLRADAHDAPSGCSAWVTTRRLMLLILLMLALAAPLRRKSLLMLMMLALSAMLEKLL